MSARPYRVFMDGFVASFAHRPTPPRVDGRLVDEGYEMYAAGHYVDEPFLIHAGDGAWLSTLTIANGQEGDRSQRVVSMRSTDRGVTWSEPVDIEPSDGPEVSKAVLLRTDFGRIYAFYVYNEDNLREVIGDDPPYDGGICRRVDSLGPLCFRYSDDDGRTWSEDRHQIPVRAFEIDDENPYGGTIRFGMVSGVPMIDAGVVYLPCTKVGRLGEALWSRSEGYVMASANVLAEPDIEKVVWETLPEGRVGLRAPTGGGEVSEEHSLTALTDGTIVCTFRTVAGWSAAAYSSDQGRSWTDPEYLSYANGRRVKCPRAANFVWRCTNGKFLHWYHNHGGARYPARFEENSHYSFENRNPVWMLGGVEISTPAGARIAWSQPEIILYDDDPITRISYPDLIEDDGRYFLTETNKDRARIHEVDPNLIQALWNQLDDGAPVPSDPILDIGPDVPPEVECPHLPDFARMDETFADYRTIRTRQGFTLEVKLHLGEQQDAPIRITNRTADGRGFELVIAADGGLVFSLADDTNEAALRTAPGLITSPGFHQVVAIVDGGPCIMRFVVDGIAVDGGDERQFGWARFSPNLQGANGDRMLRLTTGGHAAIDRVRLYDRALLTSEAIGSWRSGLT